MTNSEIENKINSLNQGQKEVFDFIIDKLVGQNKIEKCPNADVDPIRTFCSGVAGNLKL